MADGGVYQRHNSPGIAPKYSKREPTLADFRIDAAKVGQLLISGHDDDLEKALAEAEKLAKTFDYLPEATALLSRVYLRCGLHKEALNAAEDVYLFGEKKLSEVNEYLRLLIEEGWFLRARHIINKIYAKSDVYLRDAKPEESYIFGHLSIRAFSKE